jgi:hypothetical protein
MDEFVGLAHLPKVDVIVAQSDFHYTVRESRYVITVIPATNN